MKVLVTGGAGFIGSHIVDLLIENNHDVVIIDNLTTGNKKNINEKAKFYFLDICNIKLKDIFDKERPDYVIHQAAQINVRDSIKDPTFDARNNILGSINVLENCKNFNIKKIVYASSGGAVYGDPSYLPVDETHKIDPISPYGVSKFTVEKYLFQYFKVYNLDYTILRYSNVYGPRQDPKGEAGVVAIFTSKMLKNQETKINGDGFQTRDFVYVGDVAKANLAALQTTNSKIFNIGSGKETSINELYFLIKDISNYNGKVIHDSPIPGEVKRIFLNIELAKKELNWTPEIKLEEGLNRTIESFRRLLLQ